MSVAFYPSNKEKLHKQLDNLLCEEQGERCMGVVVPHAGYVFSGSVAAKVFNTAKTDKTNFIIMGPNHRAGETFIDTRNWETPLGKVSINKTMVDKIDIKKRPSEEHSIAVQMPFLQKLYTQFTIVPVTIGSLDYSDLKQISFELMDDSSFFIASSDFIHFGPRFGYTPVVKEQEEWVKKKDHELIEMICNIQPKRFYNNVEKNNYTVCGYRTVTLLLLILKNMGAEAGKLIDYKTSNDVKRNSSFVSYAGIIFPEA